MRMTKRTLNLTIDADLWMFLHHKKTYNGWNLSDMVNDYLRTVLLAADEPISEDLLKLEEELKELEPQLEKMIAKRNLLSKQREEIKAEQDKKIKLKELETKKYLKEQTQRVREKKTIMQEVARRRR